MPKTPDEIKKGLSLYTPEEVKAILQQKWTIHLQEKLYRSAFAYIQQLEAQNDAVKKPFDEVEELNNRQAAIIKQLQAERNALIEELKNAYSCFACKKFHRNGGKCKAGGVCMMRDFEWRGVHKEE